MIQNIINVENPDVKSILSTGSLTNAYINTITNAKP